MARSGRSFERLSRFGPHDTRADLEQRRQIIKGDESMKRSLAVLLLALPVLCLAKAPPCDRYPTNIAEDALIDAGMIEREKLDFAKTRAVRLSSEKIGKDRFYGKDLYRQVYHITFYEKGGKQASAITVGDAGWTECSMGPVDVFPVSPRLPALRPLIQGLDDSGQKR